MQLSELVSVINGESHCMKNVEVTSLEFDSRAVTPGTLFIALKGDTYDGHDYIGDAVSRGAVAVLVQETIQHDLPYVVVADTRTAMGKLAQFFYGIPDSLKKIGITGTNGKTTTAFMLHSVLDIAGMRPGLIGTVQYIINNKSIKAQRTTPESLDIFKLMHRCEKNGGRAVVMEVSSHALVLKRVDEIRFDAAVFTNLTQDHLDFHRTLKEYKRAKMRLFTLVSKDGVAVVNIDDPVSEAVLDMHLNRVVTYGLNTRADVRVQVESDTIEGIVVRVHRADRSWTVSSSMVGTFNAYNICAAFATALALNVDDDTIVQGIEALQSVRGRLERVEGNVFVDYAHTPSAVENALQSLRKYTTGKLIIVFGCGGDRDKSKRPMMGSIASRLADFTIVTSDNPRSESPDRIIADIVAGIPNTDYKIITDRKSAIKHALSMIDKDDVVLVAGKGHEEYQIIGNKTIHFDDAEVIRACYKKS